MQKLKFTGRANRRSIDAASFKRVGVEDQNKVQWDKSNDFTAEVSDDAARYLLSAHPKTFSQVGDDPEAANGSETGNSSEGSTDDDASSSTRKKTTSSR